MSTEFEFNKVPQQNGEDSGHSFSDVENGDICAKNLGKSLIPESSGNDLGRKEVTSDFGRDLSGGISNNKETDNTDTSFVRDSALFSEKDDSCENDYRPDCGNSKVQIDDSDERTQANDCQASPSTSDPQTLNVSERVDESINFSTCGNTSSMNLDVSNSSNEENFSQTKADDDHDDNSMNRSVDVFSETNREDLQSDYGDDAAALSCEQKYENESAASLKESQDSLDHNETSIQEDINESVRDVDNSSDEDTQDSTSHKVPSLNEVTSDQDCDDSLDQKYASSVMSRDIDMDDGTSTKDSDVGDYFSKDSNDKEDFRDQYFQSEISQDKDGDNQSLADVEMAPKVDESTDDAAVIDDVDPFSSGEVEDSNDSKNDGTMEGLEKTADAENINDKVDIDDAEDNADEEDTSESNEYNNEESKEGDNVEDSSKSTENDVSMSDNVDVNMSDNVDVSMSDNVDVSMSDNVESEKRTVDVESAGSVDHVEVSDKDKVQETFCEKIESSDENQESGKSKTVTEDEKISQGIRDNDDDTEETSEGGKNQEAVDKDEDISKKDKNDEISENCKEISESNTPETTLNDRNKSEAASDNNVDLETRENDSEKGDDEVRNENDSEKGGDEVRNENDIEKGGDEVRNENDKLSENDCNEKENTSSEDKVEEDSVDDGKHDESMEMEVDEVADDADDTNKDSTEQTSTEMESSDKDNADTGKGSKNKESIVSVDKTAGEIQSEDKDKSDDSTKKSTGKPSDDKSDELEVQVTPDVVVDGPGEDENEMCIIPDDLPRTGLPETAQNGEKPKTGGLKIKISIPPTNASSNKGADGPTSTPKTSSDKRSSRPQRQAARKAESQIKELVQEESKLDKTADDIIEIDETTQCCMQCFLVRPCRYKVSVDGKTKYLCQEECYMNFQKGEGMYKPPRLSHTGDFVRRCAQCFQTVKLDEKNLSWETMDFCDDKCLNKYQTQLGSHCANCKGSVNPSSLGKYCVRFGYDIRQFCSSPCLEEFKKGLKVCSYCQKDISNVNEGFLAPVGDKGQFKDFCTPSCMEKYDIMSNNLPVPQISAQCAVCNEDKLVKIEVILDDKLQKLCSEPCFAAFKFVNSLNAERCNMCKKHFDKMKSVNYTVVYEDVPHSFCSKTCMNVYILANRKIVPCQWCKVKKYNFDMIKKSIAPGSTQMLCSLHCLSLYQVSVNAVSLKRVKCDMCQNFAQAEYHLTMSDATVRNFCSYSCTQQFQGQYGKIGTPVGVDAPPVPTSGPKRIIPRPPVQNESQRTMTPAKTAGDSSHVPMIASVGSLSNTTSSPTSNHVVGPRAAQAQALKMNSNLLMPGQPVAYKQQIIVKPPAPKEMRNKGTSCRPYCHTKGVSCRPHPSGKETQTDDSLGKPVVIPIPVPIYVPVPMAMYSLPFPVPIPFPLPVPVPMFVPTTRNSIKGIMKEIKKIQDKIPADPFEAELLMMAEMVADDKKPDNSDSDSDDGAADAAVESIDESVPAAVVETEFSPEAVDTTNAFGEDMLQVALKMATELEESAVDLEAALTPATIPAQGQSSLEATEESEDDPEPIPVKETRSFRGRKRGSRGRGGPASKRGRRSANTSAELSLPPPGIPEPQEIEKPDANMCLKYTFGVNAWKNWVQQKNSELEKAASNSRKLKLFKPEILQLTADELNYSLCLFVKEVRKPNGQEYAPDTIYYLCLGIQQYLFENGRIDNIFTDTYYEKFTECLDEVAKKFTVMNDSQYIVTRVEEEHLWESKQLGAHSPHVLLGTLLFFNTKHFNLTTVDEHMQLSFSHIMKHWKRPPGTSPGAATRNPAAARNVMLRFYPPQCEGNPKKKKVYEQQENESNPLRCPVKLYEFYLSKCPESVKTRNDVFYLLPERSCVPDSPVWYSTMPLGKEPLLKMLNRVKMVKEINVALLSL